MHRPHIPYSGVQPSNYSHNPRQFQSTSLNRSDTPRRQQAITPSTSAPYSLTVDPHSAGPSTNSSAIFAVPQESPVKSEHQYIASHPPQYPNHTALDSGSRTSHSGTMAVQALNGRHMYPSLGSYHASTLSSPTSMQSPQNDVHSRGTYGQGYSLSQPMYGYSHYSMPQHPAYSHHTGMPQAYPPVSSANTSMLLPAQASGMFQHSQVGGVNAIPRVKPEPGQDPGRGMSIVGHPMGAQPTDFDSGPSSSSSNSRSDPAAAAPGPIPATTPLVVRQDGNGVQWIAFEYSRDRVKMEYTIRCDVESVDANALTDEFRSANCVYPRACGNKDSYKGNRLQYESECNTVGWALADLNPNLREKRGLIQRAVDSWRNSNSDPKLRSRRVRRMAKINTRKAQMSNPVPQGVQLPSAGRSSMSLAAGQLHPHSMALDASGAHPGNDISGMFHHM